MAIDPLVQKLKLVSQRNKHRTFFFQKSPFLQDVRTKYKQNWINHLERMDNNRPPKHASTTNPKDEEIVDAPGNDGSASMPEQVKRPDPWRKMI